MNLAAAQEALALKLRAMRIDLQPVRRLIRVGVRFGGASPIRWLQTQHPECWVYWRDRDGAMEVAGIGCAATTTSADCTVPQQAELMPVAAMAAETPLRWYGGVAFPNSVDGTEWEAFGASRWSVPRFELLTWPEGAELVANLVVGPGDDGSTALAATAEAVAGLRTPQKCRECDAFPPIAGPTSLAPPRPVWVRQVRETVGEIARGGVQKVVLATRERVDLAGHGSPIVLVRRMAATGAACWLFGMQVAPGKAFLTASPERLYSRSGREVVADAVAGTRPRPATPALEGEIVDELMTSPKERREFEFVRARITCGFGRLCDSTEEWTPLRVMRLPRLLHLCRTIRGRLRCGVGDRDVVMQLAPTPAVGGVPRKVALARIAAAEPFARGWYAGTVGWMAPDAATMVVGIRSCLLSDRTAYVMAGAGIVEGSDPEREWAEAEHKRALWKGIIEGEVDG